MRRFIAVIVVLLAGAWGSARQQTPWTSNPNALKFAVIGDNGTGDKAEYEVAQQMATARTTFPFEFVIMLGDNMLGRQEPEDFVTKFEQPYAPLLRVGVLFYAALGNHDDQTNRGYKGFNMGGERYFTYGRGPVRFFIFDTNLLDVKQLAWINDALKKAQEPWKICYFHHPLYSDGGRHGSDVELRVTLEPILVRYGVNVVFSGHDHIYERLKPQKGITYFLEGSSGRLAKGDLKRSKLTAAGFDQDQTFMLVEISGEDLIFQTVSRTGQVVDAGVIPRRPTT